MIQKITIYQTWVKLGQIRPNVSEVRLGLTQFTLYCFEAAAKQIPIQNVQTSIYRCDIFMITIRYDFKFTIKKYRLLFLNEHLNKLKENNLGVGIFTVS